LQSFARACLDASEAGRLALAVLEGGVLAPRAVELAMLVVTANAEGFTGKAGGSQ
jgi:hypothetical protein